MKILYPGSFNPFHNGHQHIFDTLCKTFGKENVWLGIAQNRNKKQVYNDRVAKWVFAPITNNVLMIEGALGEAVMYHNFDIIVKGIRHFQDFESEETQAFWNEKLVGVQTFFLPSADHVRHLSSSAIREIVDLYGKEKGVEHCNPYHYWRWTEKSKYDHHNFTPIYFGKIAIGKSHYIENPEESKWGTVVDADKYIWKFFSNNMKKSIKHHMKRAIDNGDTKLYDRITKDIAQRIELKGFWMDIMNTCNEISAFPTYANYIEPFHFSRHEFIELYTDDDTRLERAGKRGLTKIDLDRFDVFYDRGEMPFIDKRIKV